MSGLVLNSLRLLLKLPRSLAVDAGPGALMAQRKRRSRNPSQAVEAFKWKVDMLETVGLAALTPEAPDQASRRVG
jgi:hypothetical protein